MRINGELFERYSGCEDAEGVKKIETEWLEQLEREYKESRENKRADLDAWGGGNLNKMSMKMAEKDSNYEDDEEEEVDYQVQGGRNPEMPPSDDDDEDEYQEYLRQKVLASKTFANPISTRRTKEIAEPVHENLHSEEYESDKDEHAGIYDALVVGEEAGPSIRRPLNGRPDDLSAVFSRAVISAPKRGLGS